jgi:hypothetical protein
MVLGSIATLTAALWLGSAAGVAQQTVAHLAFGGLPQAGAEAQLEAALSALNDFDDAHAHRLLTELLTLDPPVAIAAKAHLYLGLIEFNGLDTTRARAEFQRAVEIDPAVEPPMTMSPKARMAFSEARRKVSQELAQPIAPAKAAAPKAAPAAATGTGPSSEPPAEKPASSHVLFWSLGSAGVVAGGFALYGLGQILDYNSLASKANSAKRAESSTQIAPALANAQTWQPWSIALGIAGVALVTTAIFLW